jgi:hypothetical protein
MIGWMRKAIDLDSNHARNKQKKKSSFFLPELKYFCLKQCRNDNERASFAEFIDTDCKYRGIRKSFLFP